MAGCKPTRLLVFIHSRGKHTSWYTSCLRTSQLYAIKLLLQLAQPNLLWDVKTCGLLSYMYGSLQHLGKYLWVGKRAHRLETFLFYRSLRHTNENVTLALTPASASHHCFQSPSPGEATAASAPQTYRKCKCRGHTLPPSAPQDGLP